MCSLVGEVVWFKLRMARPSIMGMGIPTNRDDDDSGRQQSHGKARGTSLGGTSLGGTGAVTALGVVVLEACCAPGNLIGWAGHLWCRVTLRP